MLNFNRLCYIFDKNNLILWEFFLKCAFHQIVGLGKGDGWITAVFDFYFCPSYDTKLV